MKRALLAVCGLLLAAPAFAGGRGHFTPHDTLTPPAAHEVGGLRNMFSREIPRETVHMVPRDTLTPPAMGHSVDYLRPSDTLTPPAAHTAELGLANMRLVKPAWAE